MIKGVIIQTDEKQTRVRFDNITQINFPMGGDVYIDSIRDGKFIYDKFRNEDWSAIKIIKE